MDISGSAWLRCVFSADVIEAETRRASKSEPDAVCAGVRSESTLVRMLPRLCPYMVLDKFGFSARVHRELRTGMMQTGARRSRVSASSSIDSTSRWR